jgi:hypothetical protein
MNNNKNWLVEFENPRGSDVIFKEIVTAQDKTEARDLFYSLNEHIDNIKRITWVPSNSCLK